MGNVEVLDCLPDRFQMGEDFLRLAAEKQRYKFLSAIAGKEIRTAMQIRGYGLCHGGNYAVSGRMAEGIIVDFEMVDIKHTDRKRNLQPGGLVPLGHTVMLIFAPVGNSGQLVGNQFGSAAEGNGKACKNMRVLYLLRSGEFMPLQVTLPPTSLKPFREFMNQSFMLRRRATYGSVVQIGLKKMNNGKDDYSVATFRRLYDFSGEELAQIRQFADGFKEQIRLMLQQRAAVNETQHDDGCDYGSGNVEVLPVNGGTKFNYGQPLDGEREALPA